MGDVRLLHPINHLRSFKVSEEMDFQACQALIISNKR